VGGLHLIFNGDDFGRDPSINEAIILAHEKGVLTSASLMVTGAAFEDAVERARQHPSLAVGLHLVLVDADGALPASRMRRLPRAMARLPRDPFLGGVQYFLNPRARAEALLEMTAQFERFLETGLPLAHVDAHYLIHLHPTILWLLVPLAETYRVPGIRLPRDELAVTLRLDRRRLASKLTWASVYALLNRLAERRLRRSLLAFTDRVYGLLQSGRMHEPFVSSLVRSIPQKVRSAELYFHPCTRFLGEPFGPNPGDLAALLSPDLRSAIAERGAVLTNYARLGTDNSRRDQ
jgi:hopanoid biosynthesis associated protein HpnK